MGNVPDGVSTWQFNFKFDEEKDVISEDSKNLLKNAGIDFAKFKKEGLES
jgi:CCR4-NOT transcription complex subunit 7/8